MSDDQDFTLEDEAGLDPESGAPEQPVPPSPKVVIEYRSRGLSGTLAPPALILVAALAIVSYQRQRPLRPLAPPSGPSEPSAPKPAPEPLLVKVVHSPPAPVPVAEPKGEADEPAPPDRQGDPATVATEPRSPFEFDDPPTPGPEPRPQSEPVQVAAVARPAIGFVPPEERRPPEARPEAEPEPEPAGPTKEEVMDDIRKEAERKEAERLRLEVLKPQLGAWALAEEIRKAEAKRATFHDDLRQILTTKGVDEAGKEIHNLCEQYGRTTRPEIERAVGRSMATTHARLGRKAKVRMMRDLGLPEPLILDYLAHEVHREIGGRGGPRDSNEVRIQAARLLLKMAVTPPREAPTARPAANPVADAAPAPVRGPNRWPQ